MLGHERPALRVPRASRACRRLPCLREKPVSSQMPIDHRTLPSDGRGRSALASRSSHQPTLYEQRLVTRRALRLANGRCRTRSGLRPALPPTRLRYPAVDDAAAAIGARACAGATGSVASRSCRQRSDPPRARRGTGPCRVARPGPNAPKLECRRPRSEAWCRRGTRCGESRRGHPARRRAWPRHP